MLELHPFAKALALVAFLTQVHLGGIEVQPEELSSSALPRLLLAFSMVTTWAVG